MADSHVRAAEDRAAVYRLLAVLTSYPSSDLTDAIANGTLNARLEELMARLPHVTGCRAVDVGQASHLGREYLRLFELSGQDRPCPLYGGLYEGDRHGVMEELSRFYRHFGLSTEHAEIRDLPDSLATVLEFLSFLCELEARAADLDEALVARSAQKDILSRHVTRWTRAILEAVEALKPVAIYRNTLELLDSYCSSELEALR